MQQHKQIHISKSLTKVHKSAELDENVQRQSPFAKELTDRKENSASVYETAYRCLYWLAKEEIANQKFTSLLSLLSDVGLDKMNYFNHKSSGSIREMLLTLGSVVCEDVVQEVQSANKFGLLIDDVTDISNTEQMVAFVQYVQASGKPVVKFLFVADVLEKSDSANAETLLSVLYSKLQ